MKNAKSITEKYRPKEENNKETKEVNNASQSVGPEYDYSFKVRLEGDSGVGKSCLLLRFAEGTYTESYISTVGLDFKMKTLDIEGGKKVKLQVSDTAGQERFRKVESQSLRSAHACVFVFDVTDQISFNNIKSHITQAQEKWPDAQLFLVGAKSDLHSKRVVDFQTAADFANSLNTPIPYMDTSAKTNVNVEAVFLELSQILVDKLKTLNSVSQQGMFKDKAGNEKTKPSKPSPEKDSSCGIM